MRVAERTSLAGRTAVPASHTDIHRLSRRFLEPAQDVIVLGLGLTLFALMARTLVRLAGEIFGQLDFRSIIAEVLFVLVLVELMRLLVIYLEEHRVAVDFMVELGIVATLREVVLHGVVEMRWEQIAALSGFILALGGLLRFGDLRGGERLNTTSASSGDTPATWPEPDHDGAEAADRRLPRVSERSHGI